MLWLLRQSCRGRNRLPLPENGPDRVGHNCAENKCIYNYIWTVRWEKTGAFRYPFRRERKRGHFSAPGALPAPPAAGARALPLPRSRARHCAQYPRASALPAPRCVLPGQSGPGAASLPRGTPAEGEGWNGQPETTRRTASRSKSWRLESDKNPGDREFYPVHSRSCLTASPASG